MPQQIKRRDLGTGPFVEVKEEVIGEEIPTNFIGEEIPADQWEEDEEGNVIISPALSFPAGQGLGGLEGGWIGEEITQDGLPKYKDGIFTYEGFREWEDEERKAGRDGFWHWLTVTLPEGSKEAFSYLYGGTKEMPDKFKEDPLKAMAIFPEAALSAGEGWGDIASGAVDLAKRPFRTSYENAEARYDRYKKFAERTKRILEERKSRVGDAIRAFGYLTDSDLKDYASSYDEGINPASADALGMIMSPDTLFGGSLYRTGTRLAGKPATQANKALNNALKGINQGTGKKFLNVAKEVMKRPVTATAEGLGKATAGVGRVIEGVGEKVSALGAPGRIGENFPQLVKQAGELVKLPGTTLKSKGQIVSVIGEAARKGGRRQTGLSVVKKRGDLVKPLQKAVEMLDTPLADRILRNAGDLADKGAKGAALGTGLGYVAGGKEGAAAGAGMGVFGAGMGFAGEKAAKYAPFVRNKFKGAERLKLDEEFVTEYAATLPEAERKAFLNPDRRMSVSDLAAEADAAQLFQGFQRQTGQNIDIKYVDGDGMVKAATSDPANPNHNARYQYGAFVPKWDSDGKPISRTIYINTDVSGSSRNRTLFHELFHPTEYFGAPREKKKGVVTAKLDELKGRPSWEAVDPFKDIRAELEQSLFGTFDSAGNRRSDGLYTEKQMLDFENQYLDAVYQLTPGSPQGRRIAEARRIREKAITEGDLDTANKASFAINELQKQRQSNIRAKENYLKGDIGQRRKNITSEILSENFANFGEKAHFGLLREAKKTLLKDKFKGSSLKNRLAKLSLSTLGKMRQVLAGKGVTFDGGGRPKGDIEATSSIFIDPLTGEKLVNSPETEHLLAQYIVALDAVNKRLSFDTGRSVDLFENAKDLKAKGRDGIPPEKEKQLREIGWLKDVDSSGIPVFSTARERNKWHKENVAKVIDVLNSNPEDDGEPKMWQRVKTKKGLDRWEGGIPSEKQMAALRNSDIDPSYVRKIEMIRNAILKGDGTVFGNDYYKALTGGKYDSRASVKFRLIVPFALEATQAGNINIKSFNLSKLEDKINNWQTSRPKFFEEWGGDTDAFRRDVIDFFQGPSRGQKFPEGKKKDLIYQFMQIGNQRNPLSGEFVEKSGGMIESNRIERSTNLQPYDNLDKIPFNYGKMLGREYMPEGAFMPPPAPDTPQFKRFFEGSKVVDAEGKPLVVFSGHGNAQLWGTKWDKQKGTAGGFYATEDPAVASSYARGKMGGREYYENGEEYRFQHKNGKWGKKIWQIDLTPEQQAKANEYLKEIGYDITEYWKDNSRYDAEARRALATGGIRRLSNIYKFMSQMGDADFRSPNEPVKFAEETPSDPNVRAMQDLENQGTTHFEDLLNHTGIKWDASDFKRPGVFPMYLSIKNPLDASKPFPKEVLADLKKSASRERPKFEGEYWTRDLSLKEFVEAIESGSEYWSTQVPTKAKKIFQRHGYDGIKELGNKSGEGDRQVNWIAFEPEQIKSVLNRGEFSPESPDIRFMPAPTFYSKAERAVEGAKGGIFNKEGLATIDQAKSLFVTEKKNRKEYKVPEAELEWSGVVDWLEGRKEEGAGKVSKAELLEFLQNKGVKVEEVWRSGGLSDDEVVSKYVETKGEDYEITFDSEDNAYYIYNPKGDIILESEEQGKEFVSKQVAEDFLKDFLEEEVNDRGLLWAREQIAEALPDFSGFLNSPKGAEGPTLFKPGEKWTMLPGDEKAQQSYGELVLTLPRERGKSHETFDLPDSHRFPEENILAHIRFTERVDADGKKMLFLEEVQSDWNQAIRDRGVRTDRPAEVQKEIVKLTGEIEDMRKKRAQLRFEPLETGSDWNQAIRDIDSKANRIEELEEKYPVNPSGAPDMPYKGGKWEDLVLKRMMRWAADNGFDRLGWITGKDTAERYNLSKHIDRIELVENLTDRGTDLKELKAYDKDGGLVLREYVKGEADIENYIGKDVAKKLIEKFNDQPDPPDTLTAFKKHMADQPDSYSKEDVARYTASAEADISFAIDVMKDRPEMNKKGELSGLDLDISPEWAINLYDRALPNKAKKLVKKKGAVGVTRLGNARNNPLRAKKQKELEYLEIDISNAASSLRIEQRQEAELPPAERSNIRIERLKENEKSLKESRQILIKEIAELQKNPEYPEANYVDITPEVKALAEEGFSYFMPSGSGRGRATAPTPTGATLPATPIMPRVRLTEEEKEDSRRLLNLLKKKGI